MSPNMECHSKCNDFQNGMSFKIEYHSVGNVTNNGILLKKRMSLKMENTQMKYHSKWNVTNNGMAHKWNFTQNEISLKIKCNSKWNVT